MTICVELIALQELQDEFALAAQQQDLHPFGKAARMRTAISNMMRVLTQAFHGSAPVAENAVDHVLDFIERRDLCGQWLDAAFDGAENGHALRSTVDIKLSELEGMARERDYTAKYGFHFRLPDDDGWTPTVH